MDSNKSTKDSQDSQVDESLAMSKLTLDTKGDSVKPMSVGLQIRYGRGAVLSGLTHECGVFGAMACGEWPTQRVSICFFFDLLLLTVSNKPI